MKLRNTFISNSSSSSFIFYDEIINHNKLNQLMNNNIIENNEVSYDYNNGYTIFIITDSKIADDFKNLLKELNILNKVAEFNN